MSPFTNKELYMMNGGQKHYIYTDGFGDVYDATPEEEEQWAKEIIQNSLSKIVTEGNAATLQPAIDNLAYQNYEEEVTVLLNSLHGASAAKQHILASSLWNMKCSEKDFELVVEILLKHEATCITDLFQQPADFRNHTGARYFLIKCLEGNDEYLFEKAQTILSIWAWSGLPQLRENSSLDRLQFNNRKLPKSEAAIKRLKEILTTNN